MTMSLEIAAVADAEHLPVCTPFLMPFHISYSGPAPVSRYLLSRPAPPPLAALSVQSSSTATLIASSSSTTILSETTSDLALSSSTTPVETLTHETKSGPFSNTESSIDTATRLVVDADMGTDWKMQPALGAMPLNSVSRWSHERTPTPGNHGRFISAFRGRQIYGQEIDIPSGYGGLVLRAPSDQQERKEPVVALSKPLSRQGKPKSKTRMATRRHRKTVKLDVSTDELEEGQNDDCYPDPDADPLSVARKLAPCSTFNSFMLWTPDRPLDEGRDEYVRTLVEWTHLAAEIHSYDEE